MGKRKKDLSEFGEFLVAEICKTGMSKVDFVQRLGSTSHTSMRV